MHQLFSKQRSIVYKNIELLLPVSLSYHLYLHRESVECSHTKRLTHSKYDVALFGLIMHKKMIPEKIRMNCVRILGQLINNF